jgi:hypothetical protein
MSDHDTGRLIRLIDAWTQAAADAFAESAQPGLFMEVRIAARERANTYARCASQLRALVSELRDEPISHATVNGVAARDMTAGALGLCGDE